MMYNSCTDFYKFGNNTYPQRIRRRSNLGHIFREKKDASYGLGNTVSQMIQGRRNEWKMVYCVLLKQYSEYLFQLLGNLEV